MIHFLFPTAEETTYTYKKNATITWENQEVPFTRFKITATPVDNDEVRLRLFIFSFIVIVVKNMRLRRLL